MNVLIFISLFYYFLNDGFMYKIQTTVINGQKTEKGETGRYYTSITSSLLEIEVDKSKPITIKDRKKKVF